MSYDIFATGVIVQHNGTPYRYPNYDKKNRKWGDEWEMNQLLDVGLSMKGVNTGGSMTGGITVGLMKGLALSTFKRLIGQSLQILAIECQGQLSIYTKNKNLLWPDEVHFATFHFNQNSVSTEFRQMLQFMEKAKLNKMGPLIDMNYALSDWSSKGKRGKYMFNFSYEWS